MSHAFEVVTPTLLTCNNEMGETTKIFRPFEQQESGFSAGCAFMHSRL